MTREDPALGSGTDAPVELVIFDYGGVICEAMLGGALAELETRMGYPTGSVHRLLFGDLLPDPGGGDPVDGADVADGPVHDFHLLETGELGFDEYLRGVERRADEHLGQPLEAEAFAEFAMATTPRVQWPIVHEIRRLRADGIAVALLTNNVKEFGDAWRSTFPVDELFEVVVDSSDVGMRKPDRRIYELTCERAGAHPTASVFLDDNRENVAAARALGIETVHVGRDPLVAVAELRAILDRRGVTSVKPR
jgi:epoxide hydrolase-like predicted phosphatase